MGIISVCCRAGCGRGGCLSEPRLNGYLHLQRIARRVVDPLQLFDRLENVREGDRVTVRRESGHQRGVTQSVDESRYAAGISEDLGKTVFSEYLPIRRAR